MHFLPGAFEVASLIVCLKAEVLQFFIVLEAHGITDIFQQFYRITWPSGRSAGTATLARTRPMSR